MEKKIDKRVSAIITLIRDKKSYTVGIDTVRGQISLTRTVKHGKAKVKISTYLPMEQTMDDLDARSELWIAKKSRGAGK